MAIYLKLNKPPETIREFIKEFFNYESKPNTLKPEGNYSVQTYHDPECTIVQCLEYKYRSFDDVFECANTYFNIEPKDLLHELIINGPRNSKDVKLYFKPVRCLNINKSTCFYNSNLPKDDDTFNKDDYFFVERDRSKYKWCNLFAELDINSPKDYHNYFLKHYKQEVLVI